MCQLLFQLSDSLRGFDFNWYCARSSCLCLTLALQQTASAQIALRFSRFRFVRPENAPNAPNALTRRAYGGAPVSNLAGFLCRR